jgi:hypothetical protein
VAVDFASHCERLTSAASELALQESKPLAIRNFMKTGGAKNSDPEGDLCESREFREFNGFRDLGKMFSGT